MKKRMTMGIVAVAMMLMGAMNVMAQNESETTKGECNLRMGLEVGLRPLILMPKNGDNTTLMGGYINSPMWAQFNHLVAGGSYSFAYAKGSNEQSVMGYSTKSTISLVSFCISVDVGYVVYLNGGKMKVTPFAGLFADDLIYGVSKTVLGGTTTKLRLTDRRDMGLGNAWLSAFGLEAGVRCQFSEKLYAKFKYGFCPFDAFTEKQMDMCSCFGIGYLF